MSWKKNLAIASLLVVGVLAHGVNPAIEQTSLYNQLKTYISTNVQSLYG